MTKLVNVDNSHNEIAIVSLNRPDKCNALSLDLMKELVSVCDKICKETSTRVIIFRAEGKAFCAGLDLKEISNQDSLNKSTQYIETLLLTLYRLPIITIAAVHGAVMAGGGGLISVCDYVIAAEGTKFGFPETRRGLVAAIVMSFLSRQLCSRDAHEIFIGAETFSAEKALQIKLINKIVTENNLMNEALNFAKTVLQGAPTATIDTKRLLQHLYGETIEKDLQEASLYHLKARTSDEAREGIAAYVEKRNTKWINNGN